ncbi:MAG TPA: hypothetical protein VED41_05865 [Solirubrobacteraceae bacterium]|nr:hypothetical protein [Solirubrobacteraceae bacterium]
MPTFCRHNRFIERCPICRQTLPGNEPAGASSARAKVSARPRSGGERPARTRVRSEGMRIRHEGRAVDDGYRCELVPGLRASADALRLAEEIAFSSGRLLALAADPPGLYGEIRALAGEDLERATWACFLTAYLCPTEDEEPFAGIRRALAADPGELIDLDGVQLGPRTSHDSARGADTLNAYRQWVARAGGAQALAFVGDPTWSAQRRFERLFERLALPGFTRAARYELLVLAGRLGLYELSGDSLHLAGARGLSGEDATTLAAKRIFGIGDPMLLERRSAALAQAASVPVEALDLALDNWVSPQRATLGFPPQSTDDAAFERAGAALGL